MHEAPAAGAASAAAELLAFYREPVRHRVHYLHGEQELPDGGVVFRLALGRFPQRWLRDMPAAEREEVRAAARAFVRQVCLWERASHYLLLCVAEDAGRDAIKENYHLLIALVHPDRQDDPAQAWPTDCAQRANLAYETLANPARRATYDEELAKQVEHGAHEVPHSSPELPRRRTRVRLGAAAIARRVFVLAGVVAALFLLQAWFFSESSPNHAVLERSFHRSSNWMRGVLPDVPRFIAGSSSTLGFDLGERLEPLKEPRRVAALTSWIPIAETRPPQGDAVPERVAAEPAPVPVQPATPAAAGPTLRSASAITPPPAPARLAQATPITPAAPAKAAAGVSRDDVERVIASLVSYYDAGDADGLMGLIDRDSLGFWSGDRVRSSYADFFGETRKRQLRMDRLTWQLNGASAQARGEATVTAEYTDGRARLERRVPIEIDLAVRNGQARLTRLVLFPGTV